jgi:programmed cell death protein 5
MPDDLERLRQERMRQLIEQQQRRNPEQEAMAQQMKAAEVDAQIKLIISKILTPEARERLANIRVVKPAFSRQIEMFLIQLYQAGRLGKQVTDEQLKKILEKLREEKKETTIRRV